MGQTGSGRVARLLQERGYAVLQDFLTPQQLEELRLEADTLYELGEEERLRGGTAADGAASAAWGREAADSCVYETLPGHRCTPELRTSAHAHREARCRWPLRSGVWRTLFASQLTALVAGLLGEAAVLFNEQFIVKPPGASLSGFSWHRDSDWCRTGQVHYSPYVSVWCALDDVDAANGCLVVAPGSQLADRPWPAVASEPAPPALSTRSPATGMAEAEDAASGGRPQGQGVALEVRAGTAVVMSDTLLHCSGPNRSRHMRRAWMPQFAAAPLTWRDSGACVSLAIPLAAADCDA